MKPKELYTERLILRAISQEVADYIFDELSDNEQINFLGLDSKQSLLEEQKKYRNGLSTHNKKFLYFQLIDKPSLKIIGWCGFHTWYTDHNRAEFGYGLNYDKYKGIGLMSEAIIPIIEYGFKEMKLNRIEAFIGPNNIASLKIIGKFGFTKEGLLRQHYSHNNKIEDSVVYALLKSEYIFN